MNKIILAVAVLLIGGVAGYVLLTGGDDNSTESAPTQSRAAEETPASTENTARSVNMSYTLEEVAERNSEDECWTIIRGAVYDITEYIPNHPGGSSTIALACGTDGTRLFTERTDENGQTVGSGTPHSGGADNVLQRYRIGVIE